MALLGKRHNHISILSTTNVLYGRRGGGGGGCDVSRLKNRVKISIVYCEVYIFCDHLQSVQL